MINGLCTEILRIRSPKAYIPFYASDANKFSEKSKIINIKQVNIEKHIEKEKIF